MRLRAAASAAWIGRPRRDTTTPPIRTSTRSASKRTPAVPAAQTKRPQFGSAPWNAVLQSVDSPTARATFIAASADGAPRTITSTSLVAPSPSSTMSRAISSSAERSASVKRLWSRLPRPIVAFPAAPFASSSTVSFVLMSPSTEMPLNVPSTASRSAVCAAAAVRRASLTMHTMSVAMLGAIMPAPFPSAASVIFRRPSRMRRTAVFGKASVVMIASAASANAPALSAAAASRTPRRSRARGTCMPMRPVAHGSTHSAWTPASRAASAVDTVTVSRPWRPVQALALPAWTRTAAARPARTRRRATWTGAAGA
jgi:hypothetical protein